MTGGGEKSRATSLSGFRFEENQFFDINQSFVVGCRCTLKIEVNAEQLTQPGRWRLILNEAFRVFLDGRVLGSTARMKAAPA